MAVSDVGLSFIASADDRLLTDGMVSHDLCNFGGRRLRIPKSADGLSPLREVYLQQMYVGIPFKALHGKLTPSLKFCRQNATAAAIIRTCARMRKTAPRVGIARRDGEDTVRFFACHTRINPDPQDVALAIMEMLPLFVV